MKAELSLSIGEVSRRTGLSERALRHYEDEGLVSPTRSGGGRRFYTARDLHRLQQVQVLRRAGYPLAAIRKMVTARELDPSQVIDLHLQGLKFERDSLSRAIGILEEAKARTGEGQILDLATLCDMIRLIERGIDGENWRKVLDRYWNPEEQERWQEAAARAFPPECCDKMERDWADLSARIEKAIEKGILPESDQGIALAQDWMVLQQPFVEAFGAFWPRMAQMYREMDQWSHLAKPPFTKAVYDFAFRAAQAGRDKGVIPPRTF